MTPIVVAGLVVLFLLFAGQSWMLYQVSRGQTRVLRSQDVVHDELLDIVRVLASATAKAPSPAARPLEIGSMAPEFSLPDLGGRERRLQEFLGGPLIVNF